MLRRGFLSLLCIIASVCCISMQAQNISVASFNLLENDLTANLQGSIERDYNGEVAALIKVVTPEQGFTFDGGMVGIVKTKQEAGEVWVWVPHGIKKMSVRHPQLGVLRDYYFPISIEKARTYEMVLTTGKVQTIVSQSLKKQFVIFNVEPADATIEFNGIILPVDETGYAETSVPFGKYTYRISSPNYRTYAGVIEIADGGEKPVVNAKLQADFALLEMVSIDEYNGASVFVDGSKRGVLPIEKIQLSGGSHVVSVEKESLKIKEYSIDAQVGKTYTWKLVDEAHDYALISFETDEKNEIWLNGELKSIGPWKGLLKTGNYQVETKQVSHIPASETIRIADTTTRSVQLKSPTPMYSSMEITSFPSKAKVYIDDVEMGETPLILNEVLVGMRKMTIVKDGVGREERLVQVDYGASASVRVDLTKVKKESVLATADKAIREPEKEANVRVITNYSDKYKLYLNGEYQTTFTGNTYDIGRLGSGNYRVRLKGIRHSGSKLHRQIIEDAEVKLNLRTWPSFSYYHTQMSYYIALGAGLQWDYDKSQRYKWASWQSLASLGVYVKGLNAEVNYSSMDFSMDFEQRYDMRFGYGFRAGRLVMITPQVGYEAFAGYDYAKNKYAVLEDGLMMACRFQLCMSKSFSWAVIPSYSIYANCVELKTSIIYNRPLHK
ncbi:MAG: PEGA domain-containing protein [Bacteroidales bacterium]|nr:PEGA domain-containing protein [Bacteroidales bacterium]